MSSGLRSSFDNGARRRWWWYNKGCSVFLQNVGWRWGGRAEVTEGIRLGTIVIASPGSITRDLTDFLWMKNHDSFAWIVSKRELAGIGTEGLSPLPPLLPSSSFLPSFFLPFLAVCEGQSRWLPVADFSWQHAIRNCRPVDQSSRHDRFAARPGSLSASTVAFPSFFPALIGESFFYCASGRGNSFERCHNQVLTSLESQVD